MQHIEDFEAMMKHVWCCVAEDARLGVWPQSGLRGEAGLQDSAANRLIGEVVQSRRRRLLGPSPG